MKICIAQTKSLKGEIHKNIQNHLRIIKNAIELEADVVIFPELSITNYEPDLANKLATHVENSIFDVFQKLSNQNEIAIGIGMPIKMTEGINISMLIFQPNEKRKVYAKQMLHSDELPYFVKGNQQVFLNIKNTKIAIGICYETLQRQHFLNAKQNGADVYIASVAKSQGGIEKAFAHFPKIAKEFKTPVLMSNCIGDCDNFLSVGQSAIWNENGMLIGQLDNKNEGILIYNMNLDMVKTSQLKIEKGQLADLQALFQIYKNGKIELDRKGIFQWTDDYPSIFTVEDDLKKGDLYVLKNDIEIIGAINVNEEQDEIYRKIDWKFDDSKVLVVHRLVINPKYQRQGYATKMMDFAEDFAIKNNYTSIRLDVFIPHKGAVDFYKKRNYVNRGNVYFPGRNEPFHCMEKKM